MQAVAHCRRCGYANSFAWPACIGCGRDARRVLRLPEPRLVQAKALHEVSTASWVVPGVSASLLAAAAWVNDAQQQTRLLIASAVVSTLTLAGTGFIARDALRWARSLPASPAPAPLAPDAPVAHAPEPRLVVSEPPRDWHVTDDDLRAILDAW